MDANPAPIEGFWIFPPQVVVQKFLLSRRIHQVLAANYVRHALFMILYRALEIKQGPGKIRIAHHGMGFVLDSPGRPVSQGRIGKAHVRQNPNNSIARGEPPIKHFFPCFDVLFHGPASVWTGSLRDSEGSEFFCRTLTDVSRTFS